VPPTQAVAVSWQTPACPLTVQEPQLPPVGGGVTPGLVPPLHGPGGVLLATSRTSMAKQSDQPADEVLYK
jgi:hypothetical protein